MAYEKPVITEVRRKTSGEFETPVKLGAEQRYVGALLNTHNNNLEEQSIMGLDSLQLAWIDDTTNIKYTTTKFYNGDISSVSSNGYYILFASDYSGSTATEDFYFDGVEIYFPDSASGGTSFRLEEDGSYSLLMDKTELYAFDDAEQTLKIKPYDRIVTKEILCFRKDLSSTSDTQIGSDIVISEKTITKGTDDDGRTSLRTSIVNKIN
jgi:hypothetical protein